MTNGLSVNDITPLGERPADVWRGRTGVLGAGVFTIAGSALSGTPTTAGDLFVYDPTTDSWVIVNDATFGGGLTWFNVKTYGAVGDGTTDDTAAINLAIAALVAAGRGVLYFPAGTYKVTAALTAISVPCTILGDGMSDYELAHPLSQINCTSQTAVLFSLTAETGTVRGLTAVNTYAGTPSAGGAFVVSGGTISQRWDFDGAMAVGFYDNLDVQVGSSWHADIITIGPVRYGIRIRNTVNADAGDYNLRIAASTKAYNATSGIRIESSGGAKIIGTKVNCNSLADQVTYGYKNFATGIDVHFTAGNSSSDIQVIGNSVENFSGDGIHVETDATAGLGHIVIADNQIAQDTSRNTTGNAISLAAATIGNISGGIIANNVVQPNGAGASSGAVVKLTNIDRMIIGPTLSGPASGAGYAAVISQSGCTNILDYTGGIAGGVYVSGTPNVGDVPVATSTTAATWGAGSVWAPLMVADTDGTHWNVVVDTDGNAIVVAE